jgi:trehalose 6-phosphate synthase
VKLSLRFILPLIVVLGLVAYLLLPIVDSLTLQWFKRDLDLRAELIGRSLSGSLLNLEKTRERAVVPGLFEDYLQDERLMAIGFCGSDEKLIYKTNHFPEEINCRSESNSMEKLISGPVHVAVVPSAIGEAPGKLVLVHDLSFVERRSEKSKLYVVVLFTVLALVISLITSVIVQLSWRGWVSGIRSLIKGDGIFSLMGHNSTNEMRPIAKELRQLVRDLERERKIRDESQISWTPSSLKEILQKELSGDEIVILSNREPYIHNRREGKVEVQVPASGLVTALEPIMRACSGTWIAHGSGNADKEFVDKNDHVLVPPEKPAYKIRRVWLSKDEEEGYYYGFSNEGLWPLCHIAHTRPTFRAQDWEQYRKVNEKFASAVVKEVLTDDPVILIQDYHFALAPAMIRKKLPKATIITFWHIPWPNAESFGICPWREEILEGLLGSSILGFHTRFHCNNFLDATDRYLECRIDRDLSVISYRKKMTAVKAYPISIEWPSRWMNEVPSVFESRSRVREKNDLSVDVRIGIGVDRLDYTKGILERFMAVERLLELYPEYIGKFTFIQIAAPTRSAISEYQHFESDVRALAQKINNRFSKDGYRPIVLLVKHHEPIDVFEYFRGSDLCFVSSLHDGMNLVAKEFISSRDDEGGVLILSQFTGAAKELPEALVVNPYNIDQCANGLAMALKMPLSEQKERMRNMRAQVQENNVFRWAGRMLMDAARMRNKERIEDRFQQEV